MFGLNMFTSSTKFQEYDLAVHQTLIPYSDVVTGLEPMSLSKSYHLFRYQKSLLVELNYFSLVYSNLI